MSNRQKAAKKIGLFGCIANGIGAIIGSGIFGALPQGINAVGALVPVSYTHLPPSSSSPACSGARR